MLYDASTSRLQSVGFGTLGPDSSPASSPVNLVASPYSAFPVTPPTDSRVRIALPPGAGTYYKLPGTTILSPLQTTDGVLFPFQPVVNITYKANYESTLPVHSNFAFWAYKNSSIDAITLAGSFFVRTPAEGRYVIACIQFLRAVTLMFTGQDASKNGAWKVAPGTPPQVVRLWGMGFAGLDNMPAVVTAVSTTYPEEVDYVTVQIPGATNTKPNIQSASDSNSMESVKIPTQMDISVSLQPIFSRTFATNFSATNFAMGQARLLGPYK